MEIYLRAIRFDFRVMDGAGGIAGSARRLPGSGEIRSYFY